MRPSVQNGRAEPGPSRQSPHDPSDEPDGIHRAGAPRGETDLDAERSRTFDRTAFDSRRENGGRGVTERNRRRINQSTSEADVLGQTGCGCF